MYTVQYMQARVGEYNIGRGTLFFTVVLFDSSLTLYLRWHSDNSLSSLPLALSSLCVENVILGGGRWMDQIHLCDSTKTWFSSYFIVSWASLIIGCTSNVTVTPQNKQLVVYLYPVLKNMCLWIRSLMGYAFLKDQVILSSSNLWKQCT